MVTWNLLWLVISIFGVGIYFGIAIHARVKWQIARNEGWYDAKIQNLGQLVAGLIIAIKLCLAALLGWWAVHQNNNMLNNFAVPILVINNALLVIAGVILWVSSNIVFFKGGRNH